ncbi:hypothetical protein [Nocardia macrotermitis]|uniref:Uncharacterized protein n=1 Tax=Nocardia macrotermitis TaxID=2585198 RepID=A0A7K0CX81_9NOCA|nr:hypothetical protein [Nocardia macrotermitis]MQY18106.1 hypothetical protein [Nocardia macrotermitis]
MGDSSDGTSQPQFGDQLTYWKSLKQQAEDGTFTLDASLATDMKKHAEALRHHLEDEAYPTARRLGHIGGFGTLPSSTALQSAFEAKATTAPDALTTQYKAAIDIATTMRDTYQIVLSKLTSSDDESAAALKKQTGKL